MEAYIGSWKLESCDRLEDLMNAYELPEQAKPSFRKMNGVWSYSDAGEGQWRLLLDMDGQCKELIFRLGEVKNDVDVMGTPLKTLVEFKDGCLVESYDFAECPDRNYSMTYHVNGNTIKQEISIKGDRFNCVLRRIP